MLRIKEMSQHQAPALNPFLLPESQRNPESVSYNMLAHNSDLISNQNNLNDDQIQVHVQVHNQEMGNIVQNVDVDLNSVLDEFMNNEHIDMPDLEEFPTLPPPITPIQSPKVKKVTSSKKKMNGKDKQVLLGIKHSLFFNSMSDRPSGKGIGKGSKKRVSKQLGLEDKFTDPDYVPKAKSKRSVLKPAAVIAVVAANSGGKAPCKQLMTKAAHKMLDAQKNKGGANPLKKPYHFKLGTVTLWEIERYQKSIELLLKFMPFTRVVREICHVDISKEMKFQASALKAIQKATEAYLVWYMEDMLLSAIHAKWVTITVQGSWLVKRL